MRSSIANASMSFPAAALIALAISVAVAACGGSGDGGGDDEGDEGDVDSGLGPQCGFAGDDFLPYAVGYRWSYRITDLESGERTVKDQRIDPEMNHPKYGPVVVQVTGKINGETISLSRREGDRVLRFQQEDRDENGALERTTIYEPPQIRIDETSEHLAVGAEWDEAYTEIELDPKGTEVQRTETIDHIEVIGDDDRCDSPMGEFRCLRFRRTRIAGGVAEKEFQFARGIGKIREIGGNQLEELTDCRTGGP